MASLRQMTMQLLAIIVVATSISAALDQPVEAQEKGDLFEEAEANAGVRGLIRPVERIEYRSELNAAILTVPFLEGDAFAKGDLLVELDCRKFDAEFKAAKAAAHAANIDSKTKSRLYKMQAAGRDERDLARANSAKARAELDVHRARNRSCRFEAPFDGRVVALNAKRYEYPPADNPLITIIDDGKLELEMVVPSAWLVWLKAGTPFTFVVDETNSAISANVLRIGAEVDPVSQTIKIVGAITNPPANVLAGMSGTARFEMQSG